MPRGQARKNSGPTYEQVMLSYQRALNSELTERGSALRQQILDNYPDYLEAVNRLAKGIKVIGLPKNSPLRAHLDDEDAENVVYTLPPMWSALKWLLDWGRQIMGEEAKQTTKHEYPQEMLDYLRGITEATERPALPEPTNGVIELSND